MNIKKLHEAARRADHWIAVGEFDYCERDGYGNPLSDAQEAGFAAEFTGDEFRREYVPADVFRALFDAADDANTCSLRRGGFVMHGIESSLRIATEAARPYREAIE